MIPGILYLLLLLGREFIQMLEQVVYASVGSDQLLGANLSDPLDPRHIVRSVSPDGKYVYDRLRIFDSIVGADFIFVHYIYLSGRAFRKLVLEYVVVYELAVVLVRSNHIDLRRIRSPLPGHGADDIIRFETFHAQSRDVESFEYLFQRLKRIHYKLRSRWTVGLVVFVNFMPECFCMEVKSYSQVGRMLFADKFQHHFGKAVKDGCIYPFGIDKRMPHEGIVHPEYLCVTVYEKYLVHEYLCACSSKLLLFFLNSFSSS